MLRTAPAVLGKKLCCSSLSHTEQQPFILSATTSHRAQTTRNASQVTLPSVLSPHRTMKTTARISRAYSSSSSSSCRLMSTSTFFGSDPKWPAPSPLEYHHCNSAFLPWRIKSASAFRRWMNSGSNSNNDKSQNLVNNTSQKSKSKNSVERNTEASSDNNQNPNAVLKNNEEATETAVTSDPKKTTSESGSSEGSASPSSHAATNVVLAEQLEQGIKRVQRAVTDLNVGDQLSVVFIGLLTVLVLIAPYMAQQLKQGGTNDLDDFFSSDDAIDDLTKLARKEWGMDGKGTTDGGDSQQENNTNAVEFVLKDVLNSKALQQAAQEFVVRLLESEEVKTALNRLVKHLWDSLVQDPETLAQIIKLLQVAIQNAKVRDAARDLVLDLVDDPDVKDALMNLIQQLSREQQVQKATQGLLTQSAHNALNDPEILDHSMEFATDVLGDDIVQRTAGEALRNTVGHAVRPATSILLTATGVGLMIFGIVAIGYSRFSEQEVVMFESAARSLQTNAAYGIGRIITWPVRTGRAVLGHVGGFLSEGVGSIWQAARDLFVSMIKGLVALPARGVQAGSRELLAAGYAGVQCIIQAIQASGHYVVDSVCALWQAAAAAVVDLIARTFSSARSRTSRASQHVIDAATRSAERLWNAVCSLLAGVTASVQRSVIQTHNNINDTLFEFGLAVEEFLKRTTLRSR